MKRALILTGVLAVTLSATAITAQARGFGPGKHQMPSFSELDINGDGQISAAELEARGDQRFAATDTDGDGFVTLEEMKANMLKQAEERFEKYGAKMLERKDTNGDGKLSAEEMRPSEKHRDKMFSRLDADGDGMISEEEFEEARARMQEHRKERRGKHSEQN